MSDMVIDANETVTNFSLLCKVVTYIWFVFWQVVYPPAQSFIDFVSFSLK